MTAAGNAHTEHVVAVVDMLGRTGAKEFQIRYSDDQEPTVWVAVVRYSVQGPGDAFSTRRYQAAAGMTPDAAAYALLEQVLDGGMCVHCGQQTAVERRWDDAYDPELRRYRRSCEGVPR